MKSVRINPPTGSRLYHENRRIGASIIQRMVRARAFRRRFSTAAIKARKAKAARARRAAILGFKRRFGFRNKYL